MVPCILRPLPATGWDRALCASRLPVPTARPLAFQTGAHGFDGPLLVGEFARLELGIYQIPIEQQLEGTTAGRDEYQFLDLLLVSGQQLGRQTDGLRFIVSHGAILELNLHDLSSLHAFPHLRPWPRVSIGSFLF
jgi:hypothetical protein